MHKQIPAAMVDFRNYKMEARHRQLARWVHQIHVGAPCTEQNENPADIHLRSVPRGTSQFRGGYGQIES